MKRRRKPDDTDIAWLLKAAAAIREAIRAELSADALDQAIREIAG